MCDLFFVLGVLGFHRVICSSVHVRLAHCANPLLQSVHC